MKFISLRWIPASEAKVVQGIKNNQVPYGAIAGGNGSFVVLGEPTQLILTLEDENGKKIEKDILDMVKNVNTWKRISYGRVQAVKEKLKSEIITDISDLPKIVRV